jgi:tetratricopeptide (TPR) repeat protein
LFDSESRSTYNKNGMTTPVPRADGAVATEDPTAAAAIRRYEERLARDPASLAFAPLADAYRKAGRAREAIRVCREGLARFPHYTTARLILAKAHLDEGNLEGALVELQALLGASPRDVEARRLATLAALRSGRYAEASAHLEQVVRLDPSDREHRAMLEALRAGGQVPEGSPLARVLGDDTFATATFGRLCLEQGLADEAAQIFLRLAMKDAGNADARAELERALRAKTPRRKGP